MKRILRSVVRSAPLMVALISVAIMAVGCFGIASKHVENGPNHADVSGLTLLGAADPNLQPQKILRYSKTTRVVDGDGSVGVNVEAKVQGNVDGDVAVKTQKSIANEVAGVTNQNGIIVEDDPEDDDVTNNPGQPDTVTNTNVTRRVSLGLGGKTVETTEVTEYQAEESPAAAQVAQTATASAQPANAWTEYKGGYYSYNGVCAHWEYSPTYGRYVLLQLPVWPSFTLEVTGRCAIYDQVNLHVYNYRPIYCGGRVYSQPRFVERFHNTVRVECGPNDKGRYRRDLNISRGGNGWSGGGDVRGHHYNNSPTLGQDGRRYQQPHQGGGDHRQPVPCSPTTGQGQNVGRGNDRGGYQGNGQGGHQNGGWQGQQQQQTPIYNYNCPPARFGGQVDSGSINRGQGGGNGGYQGNSGGGQGSSGRSQGGGRNN